MCLGGIRLSLLHMFYVVYRNDGPPWLGSVKLLRCTDNSSGARTSRPCQVCSDLFLRMDGEPTFYYKYLLFRGFHVLSWQLQLRIGTSISKTFSSQIITTSQHPKTM